MKSTSHLSRTLLKIVAPALAVAMFLFSGSAVRADSVTTTVTAVGKKGAPPEIKRDDVKLYSGKEQMQVANWRRGETLFIAVLIDDSLDPTVRCERVVARDSRCHHVDVSLRLRRPPKLVLRRARHRRAYFFRKRAATIR